MGEASHARNRKIRTGAEGAAARRVDGRASTIRLDFEELFESGNIACHILASDGIILHANRAEQDLLGVPEVELVGRHVAEFHAERSFAEDMLRRLKRGEKLRQVPARLRARDGSIRHVEITASAHFLDGSMVHARAFMTDATELNRARERLRRKDEELHQLLDALPAAVYTTDASGRVTYYNRAAVELAGREPRIGEDTWCVSYRLRTPAGDELPAGQCPMATALKENRPIRGIEVQARRPDGTLVSFLPFPTPLRDENGALIGAVNMLIDISERKQAETHQRALLEELNHRVKNNMQMLHGLLQSAMREVSSEEARAVIRNASQRVSAMAAAQQLLYSDSNPRSFNIGAFLDAVCNSVRHAIPGEITLNLKAGEGRLSNDVSMPLALILNELLTNAARHGAGLEGRSEITASLGLSDDEVVLSVTDCGGGFNPEATTVRTSGLGLVRGLARQLGGAFAVEPGPGSRYLVRFPAARAMG